MTRSARRAGARIVRPQPAPPKRRHALIAVVLLTFVSAFVTLAIVAHSQKSGTWDEPMHLASGYVALTEGNYLLDPAHPPFGRMWAALPLLAMPGVAVDRAALDRASDPERVGESYEFARQFVYVTNDADRLLYAARNMSVVWGVLLGVLVFAWTYEWLGFAAAVIALIFYTLEPNLAAHASLVTTDVAVTTAFFGTMYFLWRVCGRVTVLNAAGLAVCSALAIVTKFSGLIVLPIVACVLAVAMIRRRVPSPRQAASLVCVVLMTVYAAVWATYGFRYAPANQDQVLRVDHSEVATRNAPRLASIAGWIDSHHLLPNAFTQGVLYSQSSTRALPAFLAGEYSTDGWWYYFPIAFLLKTPAALLLLFGAGILTLLRNRHTRVTSAFPFVVVPGAVYLIVAMMSGINIGVRHVLPIFPFVVLIAAAGGSQLLASGRRAGAAALAGLTVFAVVSFARVYPDTLTFFTEFVGGPANGFKYLTDSNLDWGQDLKLLKKWMGDNDVAHINLAYFGTADPAYYGVACTHLPGAPTFALPDVTKPRLPGYVAISETVASGVYLDPRWRLFYRGFPDESPVARIGSSIRVYWVEHWPEADDAAQSPEDIDAQGALADGLMFGLQWIDHAILHYRHYLRDRPADAIAMTKLGLAMAAQGNTGEALAELRRAVALAPDNGWSHRVLAEVLLSAGHTPDAAVHAERAVVLAPADPVAHDVLGVTLVLRGRPAEARRRFQQALTLDPRYAPARRHLDRLDAISDR